MPRHNTAVVDPATGELEQRTIPPNPATFPRRIIAAIRAELKERLPDGGRILDPFAGPGGIHALRQPVADGYETWGVEIEREWARAFPGFTFRGDATNLVRIPAVARRAPFDAVVTSPTYGNRMADHHEANDQCRACAGTGGTTGGVVRCGECLGSGLTRRHTYRHELGRPLSPRNTGGMQWGDDYRALHEQAWVQVYDVLRDDGLFILNVKDHVRSGRLQGVPGWHLRTIQGLGFRVVNIEALATRGLRHGANETLRADAELLITFQKGEA